tara:strand:+ start:1348 stop:2130 length:783 start_codon:yes stop_codon:yes gene_type:complete
MITIILAGGLGTRISNETVNKPKPLIQLNQKPLLYYLISFYRKNGIKTFLISGGYKYKKIIKYFNNLNDSNLFFDNSSSIKIKQNIYNKFLHSKIKNKYFVKVINTGLKTSTGGRIFYLKNLLKKYKYFYVTYGDGLSDVNVNKTLSLFKKEKCAALVTAVKIPPRFGGIKFKKDQNKVEEFSEKHQKEATWINGGFFVMNNSIFRYLKKDENLEKITLPKIVKKGELAFYKHKGFWQCMDTPRDKIKILEELKSGKIKF